MPAERLQAVRHRAARLHRPAVRPAGGDAGARHAAAALRPRRPSRTTSCVTKTTLTVKPDDFHIRVRPRPDVHIDGAAARRARRGPAHAVADRTAPRRPALLVPRHGTRLTVLFGSNLGTAESIATRLAQEGTERGFDVTVGALDDHVDDLPGRRRAGRSSPRRTTGTPPDNAAAFCQWISERAPPDAAAGVSYTVFGCGNTEWASTYQAVPDADRQASWQQHGAPAGPPARGGRRARRLRRRLPRLARRPVVRHRRGAGPAGRGRPRGAAGPPAVDHLDQPAGQQPGDRLLPGPPGAGPGQPRAAAAARPAAAGALDAAPRDRAARPGRPTRRATTSGVLPRNSIDIIRRVMARFGLDAGQYVTIIPNSGSHTHLPIDEPTPLLGVLGSCVELQDVATADDIAVLARHTEDPTQRAALEALAGDDEAAQAALPRAGATRPTARCWTCWTSSPPCRLPFEVYLDLLPPLRPRYYSISSSPLVSPDTCSITAGVLRARPGRAPARSPASAPTTWPSGRSTARCSSSSGTPTIPFRPPENPHIPMIMVGAGTGLAPFRGFLQERAALRGQGVPIATSLLFFGCRDADAATCCTPTSWRRSRQQGVRQGRELPLGRARPSAAATSSRRCSTAPTRCGTCCSSEAVVLVCGNAATIAPGVRASLDDRSSGTAPAPREADARRLARRTRVRRAGCVEDIWG